MGYRVTRRVGLGRGFGLNVGKKGVSFSRRGRGVSVGTSGFSLNVPGTGVSYRSKWRSKSRRKRKGGSFVLVVMLIVITLWAISPVWSVVGIAVIVCLAVLCLVLGGRSTYSNQDIRTIGRCASRLVDVVNESKDLAKSSKDPMTRISRLQVAIEKLEELKKMVGEYRFLKLQSLDEIERELQDIAVEIDQKGYREIAEANEAGDSLEKAGRIDEAIQVYEQLVSRGVDTPFCYRRLAILYRKKKSPGEELRVLKRAIECVPVANARHFAWFEDRYKKVLAKLEAS